MNAVVLSHGPARPPAPTVQIGTTSDRCASITIGAGRRQWSAVASMTPITDAGMLPATRLLAIHIDGDDVGRIGPRYEYPSLEAITRAARSVAPIIAGRPATVAFSSSGIGRRLVSTDQRAGSPTWTYTFTVTTEQDI